MRYLDEYRDGERARLWVDAIRKEVAHRWVVMEVCGGQTHTLVRSGIDRMLAPAVTMVHGPGCPVCVTPVEHIDRAIALSRRTEVIMVSFGDMLRVPGSSGDLMAARSAGADVRVVYSPLDALRLAEANPHREVVFFAVGFETTAPANAMAVWRAARAGVGNFSILSAHALVPPAMEAILGAPDNRVDAFLAAGHVCAIMGHGEYEGLADRWHVPIVVTGFEPLDLLQGIHMAVAALEEGRWGVENQYARVVPRDGNRRARELIAEVFEVVPRKWRGLGEIPASGLRVREAYRRFDAEARFGLQGITAQESPLCFAGEVLRGVREPTACPAFGSACTPEHPLGAPMVSSEGACAAYHLYGRASGSGEPHGPRA